MIALPLTHTVGLLDRRRASASAVVRRYEEYRKALRVAAISVAAEALREPAMATWARRSGAGVHVRSAEELDLAYAAGIARLRITLHCNDTEDLTRSGVQAAAGRFVVTSFAQSEALSAMTDHTQRVLIHLRADEDPDACLWVSSSPRLELVGVHHRFDPAVADVETAAMAMIASLSYLRRRSGAIATRLSIDGLVPAVPIAPRSLRAAALHLESCVEDACAHFRYPRPALVVLC
ncbi:hypothetical protein [Mycolicibacterium obuense]|uniref:Orn/DAP/Arg decarboxylase 2 N-terminal domain-containing protein n=1 Tax=Mycolicibacterium obuense TaxID=1807 RepID=A0A0M2JWB3_9MYCO|nr:hypothetical protein [Mycolicibacterium obuense]KKF01359.1 hypothetical protein WN67_14135 [Mycolicibacterium obuense]